MRGLDITDTSQDLDDLNNDEIEQMARVEHNRWNVEKLLMGYRKPLPIEDKYSRAGNKNDEDLLASNKKRFIHHDIRPYALLGDVKKVDIQISMYIPWILKMAKE